MQQRKNFFVVSLVVMITLVIALFYVRNGALQRTREHLEAEKTLQVEKQSPEKSEVDHEKDMKVLAEARRGLEALKSSIAEKKVRPRMFSKKEERDKRESQIGKNGTVWGSDYLPYFGDKRDSGFIVRKDKNGMVKVTLDQGTFATQVLYGDFGPLLTGEAEARIAWTISDEKNMTAVIEFVNTPMPDEREIRKLMSALILNGKEYDEEVRKTTNGMCIVYIAK